MFEEPLAYQLILRVCSELLTDHYLLATNGNAWKVKSCVRLEWRLLFVGQLASS